MYGRPDRVSNVERCVAGLGQEVSEHQFLGMGS